MYSSLPWIWILSLSGDFKIFIFIPELYAEFHSSISNALLTPTLGSLTDMPTLTMCNLSPACSQMCYRHLSIPPLLAPVFAISDVTSKTHLDSSLPSTQHLEQSLDESFFFFFFSDKSFDLSSNIYIEFICFSLHCSSASPHFCSCPFPINSRGSKCYPLEIRFSQLFPKNPPTASHCI